MLRITLINPRWKSISTISFTIGSTPLWCTPIPMLKISFIFTIWGITRSGSFNDLIQENYVLTCKGNVATIIVSISRVFTQTHRMHLLKKYSICDFSCCVVKFRWDRLSALVSHLRRENMKATTGNNSNFCRWSTRPLHNVFSCWLFRNFTFWLRHGSMATVAFVYLKTNFLIS